ncbi:MAG: hypothetical protein M3Z25_04960 [Actinomycetota bacterium]|nr:hypothetical protein [Actinomycetota bacterium]
MRRIVPILVLLLAALLTGCGGGTNAGPTAPSVGPAAPPPAAIGVDAPLPRYTSLAELGAATAAAQKVDKTAKITLSGGLSGQAQSAINGDGALRYDEAGPAMQLTQRIQAGGGAPLEVGLVVLPDSAFLRPPAGAGSALPPGKTWVHIKSDSADPMSLQFNQLIQAIRDNADPTKSFAQFGDAITIVDAAEEQLDGVRTMRYKLRMDLVRAADRQADPTLKQSLQQSVQSGLTTLEYTLWLDSANRLTRVMVDQQLPQNQGTYTLDAHYRDWGQPVQIEPPPPDQVVER